MNTDKSIKTKIPDYKLRFATESDIPIILRFIRELAAYEKLEHEAEATEPVLRDTLFGERRNAEVILGIYSDEPVSFAVFFHNFSTFLGKPGIYLEDLFVKPEFRGKGFGKSMISYLAHLAKERGCGRLEWWVLDWNKPAIDFYQSIGAKSMDDWTVQRISGNDLEVLAEKF